MVKKFKKINKFNKKNMSILQSAKKCSRKTKRTFIESMIGSNLEKERNLIEKEPKRIYEKKKLN